MPPEPQNRRIPDVLLERFLADDLPAPEKARIQAALAADPSVKERLARLEADRRAFLLENPAAPFAHQLAVRLDVEQQTAQPTRRRRIWGWVVGPSLAAAATFLVVATVVRNTAEPQRVAAVGQAPSLAEPGFAAAPIPPQPVLAPDMSPPAATPAAQPVDGLVRKDAAASRKPMAAKLETGSRSGQADLEDAGFDEKPSKRAAAEKGRAKARPHGTSAADAPREESATPGGWHELAGANGAAAVGTGSGEPTTGATPKPDRRPEPTKPAPRFAAEPPPVATSTPAPSPAAAKTPAKGRAKDADAALQDDAKPGPMAAGSPYKNDVVAGVNANARSLEPCLVAAKVRGDIVAGKQVLVLSWTLKPDGTVMAPSLVGPGSLAGRTELAKCISRRMAGWKFKPLGDTVPVRNYPLQVVVP